MQQKSSKQDSWSSLLSELGVEDPAQQTRASEVAQEQELTSEPEVTVTSTEITELPGKIGKFGSGIMPEIPSLSGNTKPKKPEKMSFFDRLASINLFGTGASEKIDPKVITSTVPETSSLAKEILEPKRLQKVEETPKEPKEESRPQIGAVDPWSKIATQLGVRVEITKLEPQVEQRKEEPQTVLEPESEVDEIPDIESMVSFRDLRPKKKKAEDVVLSEPKETYETADSFPRDRSESRKPREECKPDRPAIDKRGERSRKPSINEYTSKYTPREELRKDLKDTPIYDEPMELDDLDLVAPSRKERVSSFSLDGIEGEEIPVLPKRKSRNQQSRSRKHEETSRRSDRVYTEPKDEFGGDFEEDYDVLTPSPEREYGPPRDVFADLIPEDLTPDVVLSQSSFESRQRTRGSRARAVSFREEPPVEPETAEDSDPFAHFKKRPSRGSRVDQPRRGNRRTEAVVEEKRGGDVPLDEETSDFQSDSSSRRPRVRGRRETRTENEEPIDEQNRQEEQEMAQLHRNIPGWEDTIVPIVESNIARHANRSNSGRKGNRK